MENMATSINVISKNSSKVADFKIQSHNKQHKINVANVAAVLYESDKVVDYCADNYLKDLVWSTERSNENKKIKYVGQPFWSKKALLHFKNNGAHGLVHEHIIPINIIKNIIMESNKDFESIFEIMDKLLHAAVITKEEASKLDKKFKSNLPQNTKFELRNDVDLLFSRYLEYNKNYPSDKIEIYYLDEENRKSAKTIKGIEPNMVNRII